MQAGCAGGVVIAIVTTSCAGTATIVLAYVSRALFLAGTAPGPEFASYNHTRI